MKKLAYIIIKFYSLGVVVMYSPEGPQNYRTDTGEYRRQGEEAMGYMRLGESLG
jgi:hypothetical protein